MSKKKGSTSKRKSTFKKYGKNARIRNVIIQAVIMFFALIGVIATIVFVAKGVSSLIKKDAGEGPEITQDLLTVNSYSRPGIALDKVNAIVVHYVANPGSTAKQNRDYFENLQNTHLTKASSHFVVGLEGEILQVVPLNEISYASNSRNTDTIAVECCHPDDTGKFNDATYNSVVELVAWLCKKYDLDSSDVIRHYDITGKLCPKYYVNNEDAWKQMLKDIDKKI